MPSPHPHLQFFVGCGAKRILHGCGYGCVRMSDMVQSRIGVGADAD
jgi:hypothetical protein